MTTTNSSYTHNLHLNSNRYYSNKQYPYVSQAYPDPYEQLKTLLLIWNFADIESALKLLPKEVLLQVFTPLLRESYLNFLGAPVRTYTINNEVIHTREYSIADYIRENGQPANSGGSIILTAKRLTSLAGLDLIENPDTVLAINLNYNFLSNYVQPNFIWFTGDHFPVHPFSSFENLKELRLDNNQFYSLPTNLFQGLASLEHLSLSYNQLQGLPPSIFHSLGSLKQLNLSVNKLHELDSNIFLNLVSLEQLALSYNRLHELPPNIFHNLASLKTLFLDNNQLHELDPNIFRDLTSLQTLYLYHNYLPSTEAEFTQTYSLPPTLRRIHFDPQIFPATQNHLQYYWPTHCYPCYS